MILLTNLEEKNMYVIAGLGNPEKKYEMTRHNMGFRIIDALAGRFNISMTEQKHKGLIGKGIIGGNKVILVKPLTYMNLSGECIRPVCDYYKVDPSECIVVFDDISLEPGKIRIRKKGSAGGHNGIKSIISCLGTDAFPRLPCQRGKCGKTPAGVRRFPEAEKAPFKDLSTFKRLKSPSTY